MKLERKKIMEIRGLAAKYGEKTVLKDIDLDIYQNEILIILGTSGCGKTTLLKHLINLYQPAAGSVRVFGRDIVGLDENEAFEVSKKIGMLFQNGALLNSLSIADNVAIPLKLHTNLAQNVIDRIVKVKLGLVGLGHAQYLFPGELSGGMRKRAALARAIALDPPILFGDEPSAGLDPVTSHALDQLILTLKEQLQMTIVIVTHELASIHRIAERIVFLDSGSVLFIGTLKEAQKSPLQKVRDFFESGRF
jgi:phospholipid/cholesterol/gamma-HCH transport system ATP-binding protein